VFRRRYSWARGMPTLRNAAKVMPGRMPEEWVRNGWIKKADTLEELARAIGIDADVLTETVRRFNEDARNGRDLEFHRGASAYNKVLGDPGNRLNPALGPIDSPPFYATEIFPGDVGTAGGLITDKFARVLDHADAPIPGLYATGNMTATVTGRFYLGAGSSIANTTAFGYIAALHAAGNEADSA
jgi:3-oxosteroid 1-dehydrogenase